MFNCLEDSQGTMSSPRMEQNLQRFLEKYEVNPRYGSLLHRLVDYHTVIVADDSASMASLANPDDDENNAHVTRWHELKAAMKIILEAHAALQSSVDVIFVNRGRVRNVRSMEDIERMLRAPPSGPSELLRALHEIQDFYMNEEFLQDKNLILHILTDGHPTTDTAQEDTPSFEHWLVHRPLAPRVNISLVLCTDDHKTEHLYRLLETAAATLSPRQSLSRRFRRLSRSSLNSSSNNSSSHGGGDTTPGVPPPPVESPSTRDIGEKLGRGYAPTDNIDVTLDYRGEILQVWRTHGRSFPFNYGDYVVKILVGSIDARVHEADLARNHRLSDVVVEDLPEHPLQKERRQQHQQAHHQQNSSCVIA